MLKRGKHEPQKQKGELTTESRSHGEGERKASFPPQFSSLLRVSVSPWFYLSSSESLMYIRNITLKNIRLFREQKLSFLRKGEPRMWTIILGENGTCKTTVLQAIAMAASGASVAGRLATSGRIDVLRSLRRRGDTGEARILAEFGFAQGGHDGYPDHMGERHPRKYPSLDKRSEHPPLLYSQLDQMSGRDELSGTSWYKGQKPSTEIDPLVSLRGQQTLEPFWFVAGYGVDRNLPQPEGSIGRSGVQERLQSLFGNHSTSATRWPDHFTLSRNDTLAEAFKSTLRKVLKATSELFPGVQDINLAVEDKLSRRDPIERQRVVEDIDSTEIDIPTVWLSQGFQSSLAWISDLIGQILLEAQMAVPPEEMEGLVLIDEIDLHLHPLWQVNIVQALKKVFKQLQFVVTTHSPLVITGCEADEVIRLDRKKGEVVVLKNPVPEPRTLTGTELYWNYFELDHLIPNPIGQDIYDYRLLARNGARTRAENKRFNELSEKLQALGLKPPGITLPAGGDT